MGRMRRGWPGGFPAGVVAGAGATLALFVCRLATGVPMPQEALTERIALLLPNPVFAFLLAELQHLAKPLAFAAATGAMLIGYGLGGAAYAHIVPAGRRSRMHFGLVVAAVAWAFIEGEVLGEPLTTVVSAPMIPVAIGSLVYGTLLPGLFSRNEAANRAGAAAAAPAGRDLPAGIRPVGRRPLLRRAALMGLVAGAVSRVGIWDGDAGPRSTATASGAAGAGPKAFRLIRGMPAEVTANREFYRVSKNFPFDPAVRIADWSFAVTGLVARPLKMSYAEFVKAAPSVERCHTLECITNETGGDLIGNANWKGLRVRDILGLAEVRPAATAVIWRCADGYVEAVPLAVAMDARALLAYEMNGRPLPAAHGAPVRVLLPNRYGMKQPKWLTGIHVADSNAAGRWERRRLANPATVKIHSAFRVDARDGAAVELGGWAFAGSRGVARVEISADGGTTWFPAALKEALGDNCWQFWSAEWKPPAPGDYALWVRAVDGAGTIQPGRRRRTPDGAEGYHEIRVRVAGRSARRL